MRIQRGSHSGQGGSVLAYTLCIGLIMGTAVAGYLSLVSNENVAAERSQVWNSCIAMAEAGIEEALAHINETGLAKLASQGWGSDGGQYTLERWLGESKYLVKISPTDPPVILGRGYVPAPLAGDQYLSRLVECRTRRENMFSKALVADQSIDLKGNNVTVDSFISTDSNFSTDGKYDKAKRRDHGDIATNSGITNSFSAGNANIAGKVSTGANGTVALGPNGTVGSLNWVNTGTSGIETGYSSDDMNLDFPPVHPPFESAVAPMAGTVSEVAYDYVLEDGNYEISSVNNNTIYVKGHATLLITTDLKISKGGIYIAEGASLNLYVAAPSAVIGGDGIMNHNTSASTFYYYGLPSNTSLALAGNSAFTGAVYAPSTEVGMGGGGTTLYDFTGAMVCKTLTLNGHYNIHYDEALNTIGPALLYVATTWNEL